MYFRKYRLRKIWLDKFLKSRVSEDPETDNKENGSRHCSNLMTAPLQYLLITLKVVAFEKVSFSHKQSSKAAF